MDLTGLADGEHRVNINLTADYGRSYVLPLDFTRDTTPPSISFTQLEDLYDTLPAAIIMMIEDVGSAVAQVTYQLDGGAAISLTEHPDTQGRYEFDLPLAIATGQHSLIVLAADEVGNERMEERSFEVSRNLPRLSLTSPTLTTNSTYRLTATLDPGGYTEGFTASCQLEGATASIGEVVANRLSCSLALNTDGAHGVEVTLSAVGLTDTSSHTFSIVRDTTPPSVDLAEVASEYDGSEPAQRLTITDNHAEVTTADWRIGQLANGVLTRIGASDEWSFTMPVASLPTGAHQIEFNVGDSLGNNRLHQHDFLVLKDSPTVQLTSAARTNLNSYDLMANLDAGSYLGSYSGDCSLGGENVDLAIATINTQLVLSCTLDLTGLDDGDQRVNINLTADYGRSYPLSLDFIRDTTGPEIDLSSLAASYDGIGETISVGISDALSEVVAAHYRFDDSPEQSLVKQGESYPVALSDSLVTGRHTIEVRAVDSLGNEATKSASFVLLRDRPTLDLTSESVTNGDSYILAATIGSGTYEGEYTGECRLASQSVVASIDADKLSCTLDLTGLADGDQRVNIHLTADYGRSYILPLDIIRDTTPPSISFTQFQPVYGAPPATIIMMIEDESSAVARVTYQLDDGAAISLTEQADNQGRYEFDLPLSIATGQHSLIVRATDKAGNKRMEERLLCGFA